MYYLWLFPTNKTIAGKIDWMALEIWLKIYVWTNLDCELSDYDSNVISYFRTFLVERIQTFDCYYFMYVYEYNLFSNFNAEQHLRDGLVAASCFWRWILIERHLRWLWQWPFWWSAYLFIRKIVFRSPQILFNLQLPTICYNSSTLSQITAGEKLFSI